MCGIIGVLSFGDLEDNKQEKVRQEAMIFLATELLQLTQSRGNDATGVANLFSDGFFYGIKMGIPSPDFIARFGEKETDYDGFLKVWRDNFAKRKKTVKTFMGHCRKTSVGHANDNVNNHPVRVGDIVGIHNGTLTNHDEIFKMLKCERDGDVDSEAIVRLVHHLTKAGKDPFSLDVLRETCKRLHGSYSCIMVNGNSPNQVATFRDSRPAEAAIIKPLGIVLIASDTDFLKNALFRYQKMAKLYPTSIKFPGLNKADIDMKVLPDDHAYVWDLSLSIDKKTDIEDLYVSEKIPRIDKLWGTKAVGGSYSRYPNQSQQGWVNRNRNVIPSGSTKSDDKKTEVDAKPATGDKADDEDVKSKTSARVWNKTLGVYESKNGIDDTKKIGAIEIDVRPDGEITSVTGERIDEKLTGADEKNENIKGDKKKDDVLALKVVDEKDINSLVGDPVKILTIPFNPEAEPEAAATESKVQEVNTKVDAEAMKKAAEMSVHLSKFENDDEVVAALDANPATLKKAPLYALANRIVKQVFEETYALGYSNGKKEKSKGMSTSKTSKRDKYLIALKEMTAVLASAVDAKSYSYIVKKELLDKALIEKLNKGEAKNLSTETLTRLFSVGDLARNPTLRQLKLSIMGLKDKIDNKD